MRFSHFITAALIATVAARPYTPAVVGNSDLAQVRRWGKGDCTTTSLEDDLSTADEEIKEIEEKIKEIKNADNEKTELGEQIDKLTSITSYLEGVFKKCSENPDGPDSRR